MATLKDISNATNISISTISRVLRNDPTLQLSDEKVRIIKKTAKELNYQIKNKVNFDKKILLLTWYDIENELIQPYYFSIRVGIEKYCIENDIKLKTKSCKYIDSFEVQDYDYDGIICIGKFSKEHAYTLSKFNRNIIFVDHNPDEKKYISIQSDLYKATTNVLNKIISKGHRNILFINGEEYLTDGSTFKDERLNAYLDFSERHNIPPMIITTTFTFEGGKKIVPKIKNASYDCILCANDVIAIGILGEMDSNINIVGCDDILMSKYIKPKLTTTKIDTLEIGREAVKQCINVIEEEKYVAKKVLIPTEFIERNSLNEKYT